MSKKYILPVAAALVMIILAGVYVVFALNRIARDKPHSDDNSLPTGSTVTAADLAGKSFLLTSVSGHEVTAHYVLAVSDDSMSMTICNHISGGYTISDNVIHETGNWMRTLIGCPNNVMLIEDAFGELMLNSPKVSLSGKELTIYDAGQKFVFMEE